MIRHAQQAVRVWRQINAYYVGALIGHNIEKSWVLMSEAVVVLPPYKRRDEEVEGWHRSAPAQFFFRLLQPLSVLVEHRIDHMHECFIRGKETVATCEHVTFEPSLERVLAEHLHDASCDVKLAAVGVFRFV